MPVGETTGRNQKRDSGRNSMKRRLTSNKKAFHPQNGASHLRSETLDSDMQARIAEVFQARRKGRAGHECPAYRCLKLLPGMVSVRSDYENSSARGFCRRVSWTEPSEPFVRPNILCARRFACLPAGPEPSWPFTVRVQGRQSLCANSCRQGDALWQNQF